MEATKTAKITISEAEWEIMRVVWANQAVTSREVIEVLQQKMDWQASTIKTLLGRLVEKAALKTDRQGRAFIYQANISEEETVKHFSNEILDRVCNQKNGVVLHHLTQQANLSQIDIEQLIALLEEKKKNAPTVVLCDCVPGQCECHLIEEIKP